MQKSREFLVAAGVAVALGACAAAAERTAVDPPARSKTQLVVQNNNMMAMAVYLTRGTVRTRVGSVSSMMTGRFTIPDAYVLGFSDLTVELDPVGASKYTLPAIQVFPGAVIALQIASSVQFSHYSVYPGKDR